MEGSHIDDELVCGQCKKKSPQRWKLNSPPFLGRYSAVLTALPPIISKLLIAGP